MPTITSLIPPSRSSGNSGHITDHDAIQTPTGILALLAARGTDWLNAYEKYGIDITGGSDCTTAFTNMLNASAASGVPAYAPAGKYLFNSGPVAWPAGASLIGAGAYDPYDWGDGFGTMLMVGSSFSGSALFTSATTGTAIVQGPRMSRVAIDGNSSPASVDLISLSGHISDVLLYDVILSRATGMGLRQASGGGFNPLTGRFAHLRVRQCAAGGIFTPAYTDSDWYDVAVRGCGGSTLDGWTIGSCDNSQYTACRAEFNGKNGFLLNGNGGYTMTGCSTDRNSQSGISVTGTGPFTSTKPIIINGPRCKRDGSSGTGSGISVVSGVVPVIVNNPNVVSGLNDDGTGSNTPANAVTVQNATSVSVRGPGWLQAATTPWNILGGNTFVSLDQDTIATATGTNTASLGSAGAPTAAQYWHNLTAANLSATWGIGSGGVLKYRLAGRALEIVGQNLTPGTKTDGTAIIAAGVLPSYLFPVTARRVNASTDVPGTASPAIEYETTGALQIFGVGSTATRFDFAARIPLD